MQKRILRRAKAIHGDGFTYKLRKGTRVDLTLLKDNESVCAGNKKYHVLLTEKNEKGS